MEDLENPHVYFIYQFLGSLMKMNFHVSTLELSNCQFICPWKDPLTYFECSIYFQ